MPITQAQIDAAEAIQHAAAHNDSPQVRLVAGPGSGKSAAIEERVCWLLAQDVPAGAICAVSFTRALSNDLRNRVHAACEAHGHEDGGNVRVTTLHSLGLRLLRAAGQLNAYPVDPIVMDDWEVENIFDSEFGHRHSIGKIRREHIRRQHEAYWSTGAWDPANYLPPDPPISDDERQQFAAFHTPRTQTYACVLPGEIIRQCVEQMEAGLIDPAELLQIQHLIVDEFQDLNPLDLKFVGHMIAAGVTVFVAGDDDQSVYSFRFAEPSGIQTFPQTYGGTGEHELAACFRCTPRVLGAATALMAANPAPNRIPKHQHSLYAAANPPVQGTVYRWRFNQAAVEARAIAESCRDLIADGMHHRDILILVSNQRAIVPQLTAALAAAEVPFEHPREEGFLDSNAGRLTLALARVVCDAEDYVSLRAILCLRRGVGIGTCHDICDAVINSNLNFRGIFYGALPGGVFTGRGFTAISHARETCLRLVEWEPGDTLEARADEIGEIIQRHYDPAARAEWDAFRADLPAGMTINELRDFLWADSDEQQALVLEAVMARLEIEIPEQGVLPPRVRIMTMHGAKGLSARLVFIPALEEEIFPGPWRQEFPGLILEAARLLYVSITRARASCVLSFALRRLVNGSMSNQTPSRFAANLGGPFAGRANGFTEAEVAQILADCGNL